MFSVFDRLHTLFGGRFDLPFMPDSNADLDVITTNFRRAQRTGIIGKGRVTDPYFRAWLLRNGFKEYSQNYARDDYGGDFDKL